MRHLKQVSRQYSGVLLAMLCTGAHAVGTPVMSDSVSLGQLQYRLIDLDVRDGITPGVTFASDAFVRVYASEWMVDIGMNRYVIESDSYSARGTLFSDALTGSVTFSDGRASATSASGELSSTSIFDAAHLEALAASTPMRFSRENRQDAGGSLQLGYTLTPNTRIEFTVGVDLDVFVDVAALQTHATTGPVKATLWSSATGFLNGVGVATDTFSSFSSLGREILINDLGDVASDTSYLNKYTDSLFLSASNTGRTYASGGLELSINASPSITLSPQRPIPEPGTWALMGLGLVGVGLATRRQRFHD